MAAKEISNNIQKHLRNKYKVLYLIGRGGMASVYKVKDKNNNFFALKIIHPQFCEDPLMVKRFLDEAKNSEKLHGQYNCIQVFENGMVGDCPYFVMEHIKGEDLKKWIERRGALPLRKVQNIFAQICDGIAAAHDIGLIHRDIKPANILIEGKSGKVVITDFGIAKAADGAGLTLTGAFMGTPPYMSPEQREDSKDLDNRSDIYSLGMVLYEMCTGDIPYTGNINTLMDAYKKQKPIPAKLSNPALPDALDKVISKAIAVDRSRRYDSAKALAEALDDALNMPNRERPRWPLVAFGGIAALSIVLLIIIGIGFSIEHLLEYSGNKPAKPELTVTYQPRPDVPPTPPPPPPVTPEKEIRDLLTQYAQSQKDMDLDAHMQCYGPWVHWFNKRVSNRKLKSRIGYEFRRSRSIDMRIENVSIQLHDDYSATAKFDKYWSYIRKGRKKNWCGHVLNQVDLTKKGDKWVVIGITQPKTFVSKSRGCRGY